MSARTKLPAEAFDFSSYEVSELYTFEPEKGFEGLWIHANEVVPATGRSRSAKGPTILRGSPDCVMLHLDEIYGVHSTRRQLALAGTYVAMHEELRRRQFVVGVTHSRMAVLAVRCAGFDRLAIQKESIDAAYRNRLADGYYSLELKQLPPLRPAMICMPTSDFVETFAHSDIVASVQQAYTG